MKYLIILFLLFESFYAVGLRTDPIHREDYRGVVEWLQKNGKVGDTVIPMEPQYTYYHGFHSIYPESERVFIMDGYSMMALNNAKSLKVLVEKLPDFHLDKMVKFGGQNGHTVVYVFRRNC